MDNEIVDTTEKNPPLTAEQAKKIRKITITLTEHIKWGEQTITELVLRRPKGKDLNGLSANPTMKELLTIGGRCAGVTQRIIDELDGADAMEVVDAVSDFLEAGPQTGRKRSF